MTGLIILLILVPVVFFILLINILNRISSQKDLLESVHKKINYLNEQLTELKKGIPAGGVYREETGEKIVAEPVVLKPEPILQAAVTEIAATPEREAGAELVPEPVFEEKVIIPVAEETTSFIPPAPAKQPVQNISWWEKWIQNNPDLEKFIGENLANKIGIGILVLGISFFVKYAIDNDWVNETGRVIIGLACGGLLLGIAHYFRNGYRSFSSVLAGGGIAVFYFTIAYAFHQYQLIGQQAAFAVMVIITAFAVALSLLYDRLELAVLAVVGGFITPFLVSTGQSNYGALFTYLCILNTGLMVLAYFKRWPVINSIALIFTVLIYGGWLTGKMLSDDPVFRYKDALLFASVFYAQFMCMNIINNLRLKRSFAAFDFMIVLSTNFLYYTAGMIILGYIDHGNYRGLFTALLGVINLGLARMFYRNTKTDKNFVYLLIGLTLTFISLAAPVQLKGNHITLFWSAETVLLFWLYRQSRIALIKVASVLVAFLMVVSLLMDWSQLYVPGKALLPVIANRGFITSLASAVSLFIYQGLMKREADSYYLAGITNKGFRNLLLAGGIIIAYLCGALETWYQFDSRIPETPLYAVYLQLYTFCFALILLLLFRSIPATKPLRVLLTLFCFVYYLFNLNANYEVMQHLLTTGNAKIHFTAHWLSAVLLFKLLYDLVVFFRKNPDSRPSYNNAFTWLASAGIILVLSIEVHHIIIWINYSPGSEWSYWQNLYYKAGLSILWGSCSFVMMWMGMKYRFRTLRVISLSLLMITLIKLFGYDIRNIPPGGKIAAFILLGVLLLIISFMYQRLKKMIIDDAKEEK